MLHFINHKQYAHYIISSQTCTMQYTMHAQYTMSKNMSFFLCLFLSLFSSFCVFYLIKETISFVPHRSIKKCQRTRIIVVSLVMLLSKIFSHGTLILKDTFLYHQWKGHIEMNRSQSNSFIYICRIPYVLSYIAAFHSRITKVFRHLVLLCDN
jgi:hypothetical protein